jgi:hypothetical protein
MHRSDRQAVQDRWSAILNAMMAAGIPRDDLTILASVVGAHHPEQRLSSRQEMRPIGFVRSGWKEER